MALMRFDPFREIDRITEQVMAGSRTPRTMPMEAFRRGMDFFVYTDLPGVEDNDIDVTVEHNRVRRRNPCPPRPPVRRQNNERAA